MWILSDMFLMALASSHLKIIFIKPIKKYKVFSNIQKGVHKIAPKLTQLTALRLHNVKGLKIIWSFEPLRTG